MILKANQLIPVVQGLIDDPDGDFATEAYLLPKFQAAQNLLISTLLENPNIGDIKAVIEIYSVTAGTRSLNSFGLMGDGKPLQLLKDVISIEEKVVGQGVQDYTYLTRQIKLPNVVPGATNQMYSWTGQDILLLGATSDLDFRIYGTFEPQVLATGESLLVPGTASIIQFRVAALVAGLRGNLTLSAMYERNAIDAEDSHFNHLIMAQQSIPTRMRAYPRTGFELRYI